MFGREGMSAAGGASGLSSVGPAPEPGADALVVASGWRVDIGSMRGDHPVCSSLNA